MTSAAVDGTATRWYAAWIADARAQLGPERWAMLSLVYGAGLTQRQVALRLKRSEARVASEVSASMQTIASIVSAETVAES